MSVRKSLYHLSLLLSCSIIGLSCQARSAGVPVDEGNGNGAVLIELYTSEGCSSCPSAEKLMPELQKEFGDNLHILEFHVDYWDRLGWKDPFSEAAFSQRQGMYTRVFNTSSVYTPQAVVNGVVHATGSDRQKLEKMIRGQLSGTGSRDISLTANPGNARTISVSYKTSLAKNEVLNIALVQSSATTGVKRGENAGRELKHANVVRSFETMKTSEGELSLALPDGLSYPEVHIIAYVQKTDDMKIVSVKDAGIAQ